MTGSTDRIGKFSDNSSCLRLRAAITCASHKKLGIIFQINNQKALIVLVKKYLCQSTSWTSWDVNGWGIEFDGGKIKGNPLARLFPKFPVATKNMGGKLGYVTSLDGGRAKEGGLRGGIACGTGIAALVMEEPDENCDELELDWPSE